MALRPVGTKKPWHRKLMALRPVDTHILAQKADGTEPVGTQDPGTEGRWHRGRWVHETLAQKADGSEAGGYRSEERRVGKECW